MDLKDVVGWPHPATKHPHSYFLTSPPSAGWRQKIGRRKARKLIGQDLDDLVGEGRGGKNKQSKGNCSPRPTGRLKVKLVSKQQPPWKPKPLSSSVTKCDVIWYGIALWQFRLAVPAMSHPSLLPTHSLLTVGAEWEKEKALSLCKDCSAIAKTLLC